MKGVAAFLLVLCYLTVSHAWKCKEGPQVYSAQQIDAGSGHVVVRDRNHYVYFLKGSSWCRLGAARLKHVTVGPTGVWGVDRANQVYKYVAGRFRVARGIAMRQVDGGAEGQIVGVGNNNRPYCLVKTSALAFKGGRLSWSAGTNVQFKYISCGPWNGCWGINTGDQIFFTRINPANCGMRGWLRISGGAVMVEVGTDGTVFVVNSAGQVFQRLGVSRHRPQGTSWRHIKMCMNIKHLGYDLGTLWAVTKGGNILQCTH